MFNYYIFIIIIIVCVMYTLCMQGKNVEIRGQLEGVCSLLSPWHLRI